MAMKVPAARNVRAAASICSIRWSSLGATSLPMRSRLRGRRVMRDKGTPRVVLRGNYRSREEARQEKATREHSGARLLLGGQPSFKIIREQILVVSREFREHHTRSPVVNTVGNLPLAIGIWEVFSQAEGHFELGRRRVGQGGKDQAATAADLCDVGANCILLTINNHFEISEIARMTPVLDTRLLHSALIYSSIHQSQFRGWKYRGMVPRDATMRGLSTWQGRKPCPKSCAVATWDSIAPRKSAPRPKMSCSSSRPTTPRKTTACPRRT